MIVAGATALFSTMLGALAAYAFSRFRFKGRRMGMVAAAADPDVPADRRGRRDLPAGAERRRHLPPARPELAARGDRSSTSAARMGVQTWLMKGFFDTIPQELDESARVDGATPAQIFWGVDAAARGTRARRRRADLVRLHAERVRDRLGAAADERPLHACRSDAGLHQPAVRPALGAVRRGRADGDDPGGRCSSSSCSGGSSAG